MIRATLIHSRAQLDEVIALASQQAVYPVWRGHGAQSLALASVDQREALRSACDPLETIPRPIGKSPLFPIALCLEFYRPFQNGIAGPLKKTDAAKQSHRSATAAAIQWLETSARGIAPIKDNNKETGEPTQSLTYAMLLYPSGRITIVILGWTITANARWLPLDAQDLLSRLPDLEQYYIESLSHFLDGIGFRLLWRPTGVFDLQPILPHERLVGRLTARLKALRSLPILNRQGSRA